MAEFPYSLPFRWFTVGLLRANGARCNKHTVNCTLTFKSMTWNVIFGFGRTLSAARWPATCSRNAWLVKTFPSSGTKTFSLNCMAMERYRETERESEEKSGVFVQKLNFIHSVSFSPLLKINFTRLNAWCSFSFGCEILIHNFNSLTNNDYHHSECLISVSALSLGILRCLQPQ